MVFLMEGKSDGQTFNEHPLLRVEGEKQRVCLITKMPKHMTAERFNELSAFWANHS